MLTRAISRSSRIAIASAATGFMLLLPIKLNAQLLASSAPVEAADATDPSGYTTPVASVVPSTATPAPAWHETAIPEDKQITAKVTNGVLIVDGLVAKVQLNYEIHHAGFVYIFVPGVGTAIVSRVQTYGSTKVPNAFHGTTLAFSTGGHDFELNSQSPLTPGKEDAYVRLDNGTLGLDRMPMLGYGSTTRAPYAWPLSGPATKGTMAHFVQPPPVPASALPRMMSAPAATALAADNQNK